MVQAVRHNYIEGDSTTRAAEKAAPADIEITRLVEKAASGDYEAFGELYSIYLDRIYRYVFYQVRDRMTAEDLAEEIFMKAWESLGKNKRQIRTFSSWLYRIAHNHVIDYIRTRRQHESLTEAVPDASSPVQEAEVKLTQQQLADTLASLPAQQRQTVILKFIEELDNREIARIMRKRPGAVRVMQMRALASLRQKLSSGGNVYENYTQPSL